jgi:hypothetical protein
MRDTTDKIWNVQFLPPHGVPTVAGLDFVSAHDPDDSCPEAWECEKRGLEVMGFVILEFANAHMIFQVCEQDGNNA